MMRVVKAFLLSAAMCATAAQAAIQFQNLGTSAPPATMGGHTMTPFSTAAQAALANFSTTTTIPGSPIAGNLTTSLSVDKRTVPSGGWATWSHSYAGPVFFRAGATLTLTLPPSAQAFYLFTESNAGTVAMTATTNSGVTSGPINVVSSAGATGFGFYSNAGETISTITITTTDLTGFAIGEFAIDGPPVTPLAPAVIPTLSEWGMIALMLLVAGTAAGAIRGGRNRL